MARENLWFVAKTVRQMQQEDPESFTALKHRQASNSGSRGMAEGRRQHVSPCRCQDRDSPAGRRFLEKERWDFENTPPEKYPLLLNYHPLVVYRQVIKQADVVPAMFLLGNEFSLERSSEFPTITMN